ncbi:MAG: hypothetical protein AB7F39_03715 [Variibacter sp.]
MTFTLHDIAAFLRSYPWWAGPSLIAVVWITLRVAARSWRNHVERPKFSDHDFEQSGVRVDYGKGTIRLPHGQVAPVSAIRSLRWEDYSPPGLRSYYAYIELDDMIRPICPIPFSRPRMPEEFIARLRAAIERAGGPCFVMIGTDKFDFIGPDYSNPIMAGVAKKVIGHGRRAAYAVEGRGVSKERFVP